MNLSKLFGVSKTRHYMDLPSDTLFSFVLQQREFMARVSKCHQCPYTSTNGSNYLKCLKQCEEDRTELKEIEAEIEKRVKSLRYW